MVQCCSDLHIVHWGGKSVASHFLCESHRDLPPLPHHDALHHLPPSLQVILLDAKYNYKYIFQTGARLMQNTNTNTNTNTYSRLQHDLCKLQLYKYIFQTGASIFWGWGRRRECRGKSWGRWDWATTGNAFVVQTHFSYGESRYFLPWKISRIKR